MIACSVTDGATGRSNSELATVELVTRSVAELGSFIDDLIESGEDVVSKLHLSDGCSTSGSHTNSKASNTLFRQRSVENTISSVLLVQTHSASKDTAKLNILTKNDSLVVTLKCHIQSMSNSSPQVHIL